MGHAMAGAVALLVPIFFILFGFTVFLINTIRGTRSERAEKEKQEHAPKPSPRPLPKKLRDAKKP